MRGAAPRRTPGLALAGVAAAISGVSVFINSYGVRAVPSPAVYTTAKNMVAGAALTAVAAIAWRAKWPPVSLGNFVTVERVERPPRLAIVLALAYVGIVSGGLAFVLFYNGLAVSTPASTAFWRDTLLIWVALLAGPVLAERLRWWNGVAVGLVVLGQVVIVGGVGPIAISRGELAVLATSVLWAVEVVVMRRLLRGLAPALVCVVRMAGGAATLVAYLAATGQLGALASLNGTQWSWAVGTGLLLAGFVATWVTALSRARAIDVSSVLAASAILTWLLQLAAGATSATRQVTGLVLVAIGVALVAVEATRRRDALAPRGPRGALP